MILAYNILTCNLLLPRVQGEEKTQTLKYALQKHNKIFHTLSWWKRSVETKIDYIKNQEQTDWRQIPSDCTILFYRLQRHHFKKCELKFMV